MKQLAQNYRSGDLLLLDVPPPACRAGGVIVRTCFSAVSVGTELMKVSESKLSLLGKARARPDQVKQVLRSLRQQGLSATYTKVMNRLDSYTALGYSLAGVVVEVAPDVSEFTVGDRVACAGNQFATHAEYNWMPVNMCVPVPESVDLRHAAFATIAAISMHGMRQADIRLGETACVVGLGLLGQILVRLLRASGVGAIGLDLSQERCDQAVQAGALYAATPAGADGEQLVERTRALTGGHGVDCVLISAGGKSNQPVELAAEILRDRGRVVDIGKCSLDLPWNAYYEKELDVRFSRSYGPGRYDPVYEEYGVDYPIGYVRWTQRRNMACVIQLLEQGGLDLEPLIGRSAPFDDAVKIYEDLRSGSDRSVGVLFAYPDAGVARRPEPLPTAAVPLRAAAAGKTLRLGVIGCGNYASSMLLPHLKGRDDVQLHTVVTTRPLSAANAQRKFGFQVVSTETAAVLEEDSIDAVLIATPHSSHARLAGRALAAGKAVFVEKPLAIARDELRELVDVIRDCGNSRLMVGFNRRFAPLLGQLRQAWQPTGGPTAVHYRVNAGSIDGTSWYAQPEEGGRFVGEGGHFIDAVSWWLGERPVSVSARAAAGDADDLTALVAFAGGSTATIAYMTRGDGQFPKERLEAFGEGKAAAFDNFRRYELWRAGRVDRGTSRNLDKGQRAQLAAFVEAVRTGAPMPIDLADLLATTDATLAVAESVTGAGRIIEVGPPSPAAQPAAAASAVERLAGVP